MSQLIIETLRKATTFLEKAGIDYMLIGGYALPFYGELRTTLDIDIGVAIKIEKEFDNFLISAEKSGFIPQICSFLNPECIFLDDDTGLEIEFWIRLDGIDWDEETIKRRQRHTINGIEVWVISPEDFIVNKLARPDRSIQDEKDVKSVLVRLHNDLDQEYLERRAEKARVLSTLRRIDEIE